MEKGNWIVYISHDGPPEMVTVLATTLKNVLNLNT